MRKTISCFTVAVAALCFAASALPVTAQAMAAPTGYVSADQVEYVKANNYVVNWGARKEDCTFLTTYAEDFYTAEYEYSVLSDLAGGTSTSTAPQSELYKTLQTLMKSKHTKITNYQETRYMYCYTDCERNDYSTISSFYSGKSLSGTWDSGATWNREHTWPNSKGLGGSDENDIMMLRPTSVSENSSRGNKAYGESSGYYDPGESVRGDCARIVLYIYTRWGNTSYMWGKSGVIESLDVLLDWMEEDPVDTWEMGRNDAVQSITGTRNVFVDYPEYAWLLFGQEVPENVTTPSALTRAEENIPTEPDVPIEPDTPIEDPTEPDIPVEEPDVPEEPCEHEFRDWFITKAPTESEDGERWRFCNKCKAYEREVLPKTSASEKTDDGTNDKVNELLSLVGCTSALASPVALTLLLAGAYVISRKK